LAKATKKIEEVNTIYDKVTKHYTISD